MKQINFNHLHYFYTVAKEGSVTAAAECLSVTPQTVSGQLATFEDYIEARLFERHGKRLELNELGRMTMRYAEDIFSLGGELSRSLANRDAGVAPTFCVGVVDAIPKVMAYDMLDACFEQDLQFKLECHEGDLMTLLADLSLNKLDLLISDQPLPPGISVRARSHFLGQSGLTFFAARPADKNLVDGFPKSLHGEPFLIPGNDSAQKRNLLAWFDARKISPRIVAEFDDTALLKFFGKAGRGIFCLSSSVEQEVMQRFDVDVIGRAQELTDRYYAITPDRKIRHPAADIVMHNASRILGAQ